MRRQLELAALATISFVFGTGGACCGVGLPELAARYSVYEGCYLYDCPIAVGAEQQIFVMTWESDEHRIVAAELDDPSLADVEVFHHDVLVRPRAAGETRIDTTLVGGGHMPGYLRFAHRAVTHTVAPELLASTYPAGPAQVYAGTSFVVTADHRDAGDTPLLGHGLEAWSVAGGTLADIPEDGARDTSRIRRATAGDSKHITVKARPDATPLVIKIVPPGSADKLELTFGNARLTNTGQVTLAAPAKESVSVRVMTADGRTINGTPRHAPQLRVSTDNTAVAWAWVTADRTIEVNSLAPGSTVLSVSFDGITRRFLLNVQ